MKYGEKIPAPTPGPLDRTACSPREAETSVSNQGRPYLPMECCLQQVLPGH